MPRNVMKVNAQNPESVLVSERAFILRILRRELANWMIQHNPDQYLRNYKAVHAATKEIMTVNRNEQLAQLAKLRKEYSDYMDFDLGDAPEYILYTDALSKTYEEVEQRYNTIILFQTLQVALDENWREFPATSDDHAAYLEEYVILFKNKQFKKKLNDAVDEFIIYLRGKGDAIFENDPLYKTPELIVSLVPHATERRYGFHFRNTEEFGLYSTFHGDNSRPITGIYTGLYRSNGGFDKCLSLDNLFYH